MPGKERAAPKEWPFKLSNKMVGDIGFPSFANAKVARVARLIFFQPVLLVPLRGPFGLSAELRVFGFPLTLIDPEKAIMTCILKEVPFGRA